MVTEDSKDIPAIILRKCLQQCPEKCVNSGRWTYRNSKNLPVFDGRRQLNWKTGYQFQYSIVLVTLDHYPQLVFYKFVFILSLDEKGASRENTIPNRKKFTTHSYPSTSSSTVLDGEHHKDYITRSYSEGIVPIFSS